MFADPWARLFDALIIPSRSGAGLSWGMDYTRLSLAEVATGLEAVAPDADATFGSLDSRQLNWRPAPGQWSAGQCLQHLIVTNEQMLASAEAALDDTRQRSLWQRLPVLPRLLGPLMVRSQAPSGTRKFKTPARARPTPDDVPADSVQRFVEQHREIVGRVRAMDERRAAQSIMASPFAAVVTYSVLDGLRLMLAHDHRHIEQARRVVQEPGFGRT